MVLEHLQDIVRHAGHFAAMLGVHVGKQRVYQLRNIFFVVAQRRHVDVKNVQPVIEIAAQFALGHGLFGYFVCGSQYSNIDRRLYFAAQAAKLAVFQHAQELGLGCRGHLADLIQQERAFLGQLKAPGATLHGAGKCALLMPEDFAFDQRFRNGRAVDGYKWLVFTRAQIVNRARHHFFAGTALSRNQYGGRAGRHHLNQVKNLLHGA